MDKIRLADALADLRRELYQANEASKKEGLKLEIDSIDVEFAVEISRSGEGEGKLSFNVLIAQGEVKTGGEASKTRTHSIKLHLKPSIDGKQVHVGATGCPEND